MGRGDAPKTDMDKRIREIYHEIIQGTGYMEEANRRVEEETRELLKEEEDVLDRMKYEALRDKLFSAASVAEEEGFVKGFRYGAILVMEMALSGQGFTAEP